MSTKERIILALDGMSAKDVFDMAAKVADSVYAVKIHDLYDRAGPGAVSLIPESLAVWVDYKLHDIPETVYKRVDGLCSNSDILTVHASGGLKAMERAVETGVIVYAVTVLTSLDEAEVREIYGRSIEDQVVYFAKQAKKAGVTGIVCSPKELALLSSYSELDSLEFIVPGVRSLGVSNDDQVRVDTPANAIRNGATRLVIGRQVTKAEDPIAALDAIAKEIQGSEILAREVKK